MMKFSNNSATQNNGKITSQTDVLSGEQITYTYNTLNRLADLLRFLAQS